MYMTDTTHSLRNTEDDKIVTVIHICLNKKLKCCGLRFL